jgi:hypothetical protein
MVNFNYNKLNKQIDMASLTEINNKLTEGQFYRNGGNRYFRIESLSETSVTYQEYNALGETGKHLTMSRTVFCQLLKNRYMTEARFRFDAKANRWTENREYELERQFEFNRNLVKQP